MPVTVMIPTYRRESALRETLGRLRTCDPPADEVIVHVDAGDTQTPAMLASEFPEVECISSDQRQGPGGGRNKLVKAARFETIVSLDDDSWPIESDFFQKADEISRTLGNYGVIACEVIESDSEEVESESRKHSELSPVFSFVGCGAIIHRSAFLKTSGYLPLQYAYGMEEADVSIQLLDLGYELKHCPSLQVYHACDREAHHSNPRINGAQVTNTALLAFLRYPVGYWPYGVLQVVNRIVFAIRQGRLAGLVSGLCNIPISCWKNRRFRDAVKGETLQLLRNLKRSKGQAQANGR